MVTTRASNKGTSRRRYKSKASSKISKRSSTKSSSEPSPPPAPAMSDPAGPKPSPSPAPNVGGAGGFPPHRSSPIIDEPTLDFTNYDFSYIDSLPSEPPPPPPPPRIPLYHPAPSQPSPSSSIRNPYSVTKRSSSSSNNNASSIIEVSTPPSVPAASIVSYPTEPEETDPLFDQIYANHKQFVEHSRVSGTASLRDLADGATVVSESYTYRRKKVVVDFIEGLVACAPKYDQLLELTSKIPDTFSTHETSVPLLFVVLSGTSDKTRKSRLLSDLLVDWVSNLRRQRSQSSEEESSGALGIARKKNKGKEGKKGKSVSKKLNIDGAAVDDADPHAPSTINTYVRALLAAGREFYDWHYSLKTDLSFEGGFCAFFKRLCSERQKNDVSVDRRFFYFMPLLC